MPIGGERANILLVDPAVSGAHGYERILRRLDHNLIRAASRDEAVAKLGELDVATILVDVSGPGALGRETAALLREHARTARTPIIFVTGVHPRDVERSAGDEIGAVDYMSSPVDPEILRSRVATFVQLFCQRREVARLEREIASAEAALQDARDRIDAERTVELESLNEMLARANSRLVAEISERERAQASLQHEALRRDEFLAILAHELRNPLSAMHNAVQLLHAAEMAPERHDWIRALLDRQLKHLTRLIDDLLDVRRITSGRVRLQREPLDLAAVLRQACESVRALVDARRHTLDVQCPDAAVYVDADLVRLTQVFINLLNNAAKYTPAGGSIGVALAEEPLAANGSDATEARSGGAAGAARWVRVDVRDNGAGLAPGMVERVFDLFAQAHAGETRTHSGLGIGLSLVRGLVSLHGGTVWAESAGVGMGSRFVVRLPLLAGAGAAGLRLGAFAAGRPRGAVPLRLLIVDDNIDSASGLAMHLRESGKHDVRLAHSGHDGLAAAREFAPEVVLLDIGLPDIDGYEVAQRLRTDRGFDAVALIAFTGFGGQEDRLRARRAGFDDYLVKPVSYEALADVLAANTPGASKRP
jgi:signal transduction histidine kinase